MTGRAIGAASDIHRATDRFEEVACNLCGLAGTTPFMHRAGMHVVRCTGCGLVYVNPRLSVSALEAHYNAGESSRIQYYLDAEPADRKSFAHVLDVCERFAPSKGTLLDVGTNVGTCLVLARDRGWQVAGVEINEEAARFCRENRNLDVHGGMLEQAPFVKTSFDAVLMGDVIEHVPDPLGILRVVEGLLKPGGVVVISTPNIGTFAGRFLQVKPVEHIYYFSPETMSRTLTRAGFEVLDISPFDRHHNLTAMTHSTTFGGLFQTLAPAFRVARRVLGDVVVKLPIRENLLAVGRKPAATPAA